MFREVSQSPWTVLYTPKYTLSDPDMRNGSVPSGITGPNYGVSMRPGGQAAKGQITVV
jgi:hypothetical protein